MESAAAARGVSRERIRRVGVGVDPAEMELHAGTPPALPAGLRFEIHGIDPDHP